MAKKQIRARCACGSVEIEARGAPITSVVCYCADCQEGGHRIEALANATPVLDADGGTQFIVYRKDRVRCTKGAALLKAIKLKDRSRTSRLVATCCNSAMLLEFDDLRHWVDVYRARAQGDVPPLEMRIDTKFRPAGSDIPEDVPSYPTYPLRLLGKLLAARAAMLFFG